MKELLAEEKLNKPIFLRKGDTLTVIHSPSKKEVSFELTEREAMKVNKVIIYREDSVFDMKNCICAALGEAID